MDELIESECDYESYYYFRVNECKAKTADDKDCICWHRKGTGPYGNEAENIDFLEWKIVPMSSVHPKDAAIGWYWKDVRTGECEGKMFTLPGPTPTAELWAYDRGYEVEYVYQDSPAAVKGTTSHSCVLEGLELVYANFDTMTCDEVMNALLGLIELEKLRGKQLSC